MIKNSVLLECLVKLQQLCDRFNHYHKNALFLNFENDCLCDEEVLVFSVLKADFPNQSFYLSFTVHREEALQKKRF